MPKGEKGLGGCKVVLESSVPVCLCASLCLPVPVPIAGFITYNVYSDKHKVLSANLTD